MTEGTFLRYFRDKREVLFGGETVLRPALTDSIAKAPAGLKPLAILFRVFRSVVALLENNRRFYVPRQEVIVATPALQERELAKHARIADALSAALRARGIADLPALLAARTGMAAFVHATLSWLDDNASSPGERLDRAETERKALLVGAFRLDCISG